MTCVSSHHSIYLASIFSLSWKVDIAKYNRSKNEERKQGRLAFHGLGTVLADITAVLIAPFLR